MASLCQKFNEKMKTYSILKPKKLNLENLVNKYQPDFKFDYDRAYLIIHLVIILGREKDNYKKVGLHSKLQIPVILTTQFQFKVST
ncbi:hypothetical protein DR980_15950 [Flavobacterium psychrolimnae]|uniref:Uncharacterized protein n=1 Tax=Flavobacterium psychrolimnae TaxID=249351 RepID=A0A366AW64_9FLAO|nr:hypothetical protein DR980_15950 [Flavobacterium psychrolimnae]